MAASQVAPSALLVEQSGVPTVTRLVLGAANHERVGAERYVAPRDGAAVGGDGLARKEVELHVRAVGQLYLETAHRHETPRVLALAARRDLLDEHVVLDARGLAAVPGWPVPNRQMANLQAAEL